MILVFDGHRYEAKATYADRHVLKASGFRWDPDSKAWWTVDKVNIGRLERNSGKVCEIRDLAEQQEQEIPIPDSWEGHPSCATDGPEGIPCPPDLAYMPFQRGGIAFARGKDGVLIADEMGLGKTVQAIGIMNDEPIQTALIIVPASLKLNWEREVDKWLNYYRPVHVVQKAAHPLPSKIGVVIINYDIVGKVLPRLDHVDWDILICDECHLLKNPDAKRTRAVLGFNGQGGIPSKRRVFLTGTPLESRPSEIFTVANALDPKAFPLWLDFAFRYCDARMDAYGLNARGASNIPELQAKLRSGIMVRRLKMDVLTDLPDKMRCRVPLPCSPALQKKVEREVEEWKDHKAVISELRQSGAPVEHVRHAENAANAQMAVTRKATMQGKLPMAIEFVKTAIDGGKVVVFAKHHDVIDELTKAFKGKCVVVTGKTPSDKDRPGNRQELIDKFQTDPDCLVFIGQINAVGAGVTLTASSHVIFVEYDWRPGVLSQAEDRCHRIGQRDSVTCTYTVLENSLDDVMLGSADKKNEIIHGALDL